MFISGRGAVIGNCNLTTGGLGIAPQSQLGFVQQIETDAKLAISAQWFETEWNAANSHGSAVSALIEAATADHSPAAVYTQALHQLFAKMEEGTDEARREEHPHHRCNILKLPAFY